jgi:hypothetical protein
VSCTPDQAPAAADKNGGANGDGYARQAMLLANYIAGSFPTPANDGGKMVADSEAQNPLLAAPHNLYRLYEGRGTSTWNSYAVVGEETPGVPTPGVSGRYDRQAGLRALPKDQVGDRAGRLAACGARGKRLG